MFLFKISTHELFTRLFPNFTFRKKSQITDRTQIGRWIQLLSSLEDVTEIVEIGTWNGNGSSQCIVKGVLQRSKIDCRVIGIELNPRFAAIAQKKLQKYDFFQVLCGYVCSLTDLEVQDLSQVELKWFENDSQLLLQADNVIEQLPKEIDLLVLDGGEFSTYSEFKNLEPKLRNWIILDDTSVRKCKVIYEKIASSPKYQIVFESHERNGIAIVRVLGR